MYPSLYQRTEWNMYLLFNLLFFFKFLLRFKNYRDMFDCLFCSRFKNSVIHDLYSWGQYSSDRSPCQIDLY